jgi:hypothetical protein
MGNSPSSAVAVMAAKSKLGGVLGDDNAAPDSAKTDKMRQDLADKRKDREEDYTKKAADRKANKSKLSAMWAENKAKNKS